MRNVGALILAAGGSMRLGEPKQFLQFKGETLLRRIAKAAHDAGCAPIVVVAGNSADRASAELHDLPVHVVQNLKWRAGIGTSIKCGLANLRNTVCEIVILACDQPFVSAKIIREICGENRPIVASGYADSVGIPARFDSRYFDALASVPDTAGAKSLIEGHAADVAVVPFPEGAIDIDTRDDYEALSHQLA